MLPEPIPWLSYLAICVGVSFFVVSIIREHGTKKDVAYTVVIGILLIALAVVAVTAPRGKFDNDSDTIPLSR